MATTAELPESIFTMHGWCTKEKATRMYELIREAKPNVTVELGVFGGRSLIPMALAHKHISQGVCYAIDPWQISASTENYDVNDPNYQWWNKLDHGLIYNSFINALNLYGVKDIVKVYKELSKNTLHLFEDESICVLHQDGNHSESTSTEEVLLYAPKIKKGGYWIMDDTDWQSTTKAQNTLMSLGFELLEDHVAWKIFQKV
jgi:hypothetical protein